MENLLLLLLLLAEDVLLGDFGLLELSFLDDATSSAAVAAPAAVPAAAAAVAALVVKVMRPYRLSLLRLPISFDMEFAGEVGGVLLAAAEGDRHRSAFVWVPMLCFFLRIDTGGGDAAF